MDINATTELQQHLDNNEKLVWTGRPKTGIVFRTADIFLIPFSLLLPSRKRLRLNKQYSGVGFKN